MYIYNLFDFYLLLLLLYRVRLRCRYVPFPPDTLLPSLFNRKFNIKKWCLYTFYPVCEDAKKKWSHPQNALSLLLGVVHLHVVYDTPPLKYVCTPPRCWSQSFGIIFLCTFGINAVRHIQLHTLRCNKYITDKIIVSNIVHLLYTLFWYLQSIYNSWYTYVLHNYMKP